MTVSVRFRFETSTTGGYVPVLGNSAVVSGPIASQNAGSCNPGIYYQVGGGGLNGRFAAGLHAAAQLDTVNTALVAAYEQRFGPGAWARDSLGPSSAAPLTSFLIPLAPGVAPIGSELVAMMYSLGPVLGPAGLIDRAAYAAIYTDAMAEISRYRAAGHTLMGLRITMLSTGVYAARVEDPEALFVVAAASILDGIIAGVQQDPALADVTILINSDEHPPKERFGFESAARQRGLQCDTAGFDLPLR